MLRNVCIAALHNAMPCSAMLRQLCFVLVLRYALLHYGTFVKLCYSTLRYLCFVTLVTLRLLCYVTFGYLHYIALRYAMAGCCIMVCDVTLRYAILCYRYLCCVFEIGQMLQSSSVLLRFDLSKVTHLIRYVSIRCLW